MSDYQEIFDANLDISEDECVMLIYGASEGDLSIKDAQAEYHTLAVAAGIIKTPAQKKTDFITAIEGVILSTVEGVNEAKAAGADLEIGTATVNKYLKEVADEQDIKLAITVKKRGNSMSGQLKEWFIANPDSTNEQIVEKGIELGMTEISAKYYVPIYNTALEIAKAIS